MKIKCRLCKDIIENQKGSIKYCKCKKTYIDQTHYYTKIAGDFFEVKEEINE